jgi:hypothetical protein
MGCRIAVRLAEIAAARDDLAVAHDHRAERIIALPRLVERKPHEALVAGRGDGGRRCAARGQHRGRGKADDHAAPAGTHRRNARFGTIVTTIHARFLP